jgi:hypothetical protein
MGKPLVLARDFDSLVGEYTRGSKTFQYPEENKTIRLLAEHFLSSGERKGNSPNPAVIFLDNHFNF